MMRSIDRLLASRLFLRCCRWWWRSWSGFTWPRTAGLEVVRTRRSPWSFSTSADMSVASGVRDVDIQDFGYEEDTS